MFAGPVPICAQCKFSFTLEDQPKYRRCQKSIEPERADASLCGEMRKGACGPTATMWEKRDDLVLLDQVEAKAILMGRPNGQT
jgi:hypothetical protein